MQKVGIICEYNPFHNGHIYHINKIKELFPDEIIILVMSSNITQRGDFSILDKWEKTDIALDYVDLVIELPSIYTIQSADGFAEGAITILKNLNVDKIVFGTETLNANDLNQIAQIQKSKKFNELVKKYLDDGINYPTALAKGVFKLTNIKIEKPNDLLGLSYIKELSNMNIKPIIIKRTNDYHSKDLNDKITSATSIREALKNKKDIEPYVPKKTYNYLKNYEENNYFKYPKYKIISEIDNLSIYLNVDEGIENRIKKYIYNSCTLDDLIEKIKTKRYTYNKIKRMLLCILLGITKEDNKKLKKIEYIRVLGFNKKGRNYLKKIKDSSKLPLITNYKSKYKSLELELKIAYIYYLNKKDKDYIIEYKHKPIIK